MEMTSTTSPPSSAGADFREIERAGAQRRRPFSFDAQDGSLVIALVVVALVVLVALVIVVTVTVIAPGNS
jgi:hypothetical protein